MLIEISATESSDIIAACLIAEKSALIMGCHTPIVNSLPRIRHKLSEAVVSEILPILQTTREITEKEDVFQKRCGGVKKDDF